jgi:hypothetical protein
MNKLAFLAQIILLLLAWSVASASALPTPERFVYDASWGGVSVGSAVQTVTARGDEIAIVNTIRSSGLMSAMFSIDDVMESVVAAGEGAEGKPKAYRENIKEGRYRARKEGRFDFANLTVDSTDLLKKTERSDTISENTYDSLSSIYFIRSRELAPGQTFS